MSGVNQGTINATVAVPAPLSATVSVPVNPVINVNTGQVGRTGSTGPQGLQGTAGPGSLLKSVSYISPANPPDSTSNSTVTSNVWIYANQANLKVTFTAPASGEVLVTLSAVTSGTTSNNTQYWENWGLTSSSTDPTVPFWSTLATAGSNNPAVVTVTADITGLTPGQSYTYYWVHSAQAYSGSTGSGIIYFGKYSSFGIGLGDSYANIFVLAVPTPGQASLVQVPNWRGTWNSASTYGIADAVTRNGSSYWALAINTNVDPDVETSVGTVTGAHWQAMAIKGAAAPASPVLWTPGNDSAVQIPRPSVMPFLLSSTAPSSTAFGPLKYIYTCPAGKVAFLNWFIMRNQAGIGQSNLYILRNGDTGWADGSSTTPSADRVAYTLSAGGSISQQLPIWLAPGESLAIQGANGADFRLAGNIRTFDNTNIGFKVLHGSIPADTANHTIYTCPTGKVASHMFELHSAWVGATWVYNTSGTQAQGVTTLINGATMNAFNLAGYNTNVGVAADFGLTAGQTFGFNVNNYGPFGYQTVFIEHNG